MQGPEAMYDIASLLLGAVKDDLTTLGVTLNRVCVVPGQIAWDECECGQLVVSLYRMWWSNDFPEEATSETHCNESLLCGQFTFAYQTCAPNPIGNAIAPTCEALDTSAQTVMAAAWQMFTTLTCETQALADNYQIMGRKLNSIYPKGPDGGCVGAEVQVSVAIRPGFGPTT